MDRKEIFIRDCSFSRAVRNSALMADALINSPECRNIVVSISGGADSDVLLDLFTHVDTDRKCTYMWFDTGVEFEATKRHLCYLEERYRIEIVRRKPRIQIPESIAMNGSPFLSKRISAYIHRLQEHGFGWEDEPYEAIARRYPGCTAALKWWCNLWGDGSMFNIGQRKWLKEFMIQNPPWFRISDCCCRDVKMRTVREMIRECRADLNVSGVRRAEGGQRAVAYSDCYTGYNARCGEFRPLFHWTMSDRMQYELRFGVVHSDCYGAYGLKRTGCCGCPLGRDVPGELEATKTFERPLYERAKRVFSNSYEYTRMYREFADAMAGKDRLERSYA